MGMNWGQLAISVIVVVITIAANGLYNHMRERREWRRQARIALERYHLGLNDWSLDCHAAFISDLDRPLFRHSIESVHDARVAAAPFASLLPHDAAEVIRAPTRPTDTFDERPPWEECADIERLAQTLREGIDAAFLPRNRLRRPQG